MKRFLAALQFLTIVPLPRRFAPDEEALGGALAFFPLVGLLIGALVALADAALSRLLPLAVTSVFTVILLVAASGALHLDGLADTADGFFSSRPRERILAIMKDSRTGPMGVFAIASVLVLKVVLVASLESPFRWWVLLLMPLAGRAALLVQFTLLPYARPEGGLASLFHSRRSRGHLVWAAALLLGAGTWAGGLAGLCAAGLSLLFALLFAAYCRRKIGGLTGDTLGAACELTEIAPPLLAAAWFAGGTL